MQFRHGQTRGRSHRLRRRPLGNAHARVSRSGKCTVRLELIALQRAVGNGSRVRVPERENDDDMQFAIAKTPFADGRLFIINPHCARELLAGLFELEERLHEVTVAGGNAQDPETGHVRLRRNRKSAEQ